jgi:hypothetical protein
MSSISSVRAEFAPLRKIPFGSIAGAYAVITPRFDESPHILKVWNMTDADIFLSRDGVEDNDFFPALGYGVLDIRANATMVAQDFGLSTRKTWWIKAVGALPTSGTVYITSIYAV